MSLTNYEKETILRTSEGDNTFDIYTYNSALKRRLKKFAAEFPELCEESRKYNDGSVEYVVEKSRVVIRLEKPWSEEKRKAASKAASERFNRVRSDTE